MHRIAPVTLAAALVLGLAIAASAAEAETASESLNDLVTLDGFEHFVEEFNRHQDVPRIVLLLSPT